MVLIYPILIYVIDFASFQGYNGVGYTERSIIMKRLFCLLLALSLAIPTFALAVSSQKLKELYASVDTLSGDELLALRDYIDSKIETVPQEKQTETTYVLNKNTMKFHLENCSSVKSIKDKHRSTYTGSRDDLIAKGYAPCKKCHP